MTAIACLTANQVLYPFMSGYTAEVAGTEVGLRKEHFNRVTVLLNTLVVDGGRIGNAWQVTVVLDLSKLHTTTYGVKALHDFFGRFVTASIASITISQKPSAQSPASESPQSSTTSWSAAVILSSVVAMHAPSMLE
jgi:hypothetical protein